MKFFESLLRNHPLANILFVLVLVLGALSYAFLPREQDPEINFNWVSVITVLPGASSEDVERLVTNPLEEAIQSVSDLRFVVSGSRENVSSILVRFQEIDDRTFDKRINDLRREIQNRAAAELPGEALDPTIMEITTSNGFPTAIMVLEGQADDEVLRRNGRLIKSDLERITGVDTILATSLHDPELQIRFDSSKLAARGLSPTDLADGVRAWFRDSSAGTLDTANGQWLVRLSGQTVNPEEIARIPIAAAGGATALVGDVAVVSRARAQAEQKSTVNGKPVVVFSVNKKSYTNTLELVDRLSEFAQQINPRLEPLGLKLVIADDQTVPTRSAISVMQANAVQGLILVALVCWVFLGWKVAALITLGIAFSMTGTFLALRLTGDTLNISVLLGVVIALGMLVDDGVVVVEAIYYRIARGQETFSACLEGVVEVWKPVLASVLTTMAAFLPLMLLPGIVGKFMFVIPFVVTVALLVSLVEAFWMLPAHIMVSRLQLDNPGRTQRLRNRLTHGIRNLYSRWLVKALRHPVISLSLVGLLVAGAGAALATGQVRMQFFTFDSLRIFYVNVDMPSDASIDDTSAELNRIEAIVRKQLKNGEARSVISQAGLKFTETEPLYGAPYGQVIVSLNAPTPLARSVSEVIEAVRGPVEAYQGLSTRSILQLSGGPPRTKPISVKVRGDNYDELRRAVDDLMKTVATIPGAKDVVDDDIAGRPELELKLNSDAMRRLGLNPVQVARTLRLAVDGEVVSVLRHAGDRIELRVIAEQFGGDASGAGGVGGREDVASVLQSSIALPAGGSVRLESLVDSSTRSSRRIVRHYNFRRTITIEANIALDADGQQLTDTVQANRVVREQWQNMRVKYPGVDLDFSGELEDIQESLDAFPILLLFGVGLIYLILATQFRSYFQPLLMITTVPLAFSGVTLGLLISGHPLSLFTIYGVTALVGITVNSAIVLTDAANRRLEAGYPLMHAVVLAGRRRVVPVIITSLTTIAGLFALAVGLGGKSLMWGPVASSIVWGLGVATILTLFVVPILYSLFMRPWFRRSSSRQAAAVPTSG
ncbi:MAG: efflux RND transporter permease subunit [Burkholderiaceae bacterium]